MKRPLDKPQRHSNEIINVKASEKKMKYYANIVLIVRI